MVFTGFLCAPLSIINLARNESKSVQHDSRQNYKPAVVRPAMLMRARGSTAGSTPPVRARIGAGAKHRRRSHRAHCQPFRREFEYTQFSGCQEWPPGQLSSK